MKGNRKLLLFTTLVCLLPAVFGLLVWDRLPDSIPIHYDIHFEPDSYASKLYGILIVPCICALVNVLVFYSVRMDRNNESQSAKVMGLVYWLVPLISLVTGMTVILSSLRISGMEKMPVILIGVLFILIGNILPKCRYNHTIGIRVPWTLASEEVWKRTHRMAGALWVLGGIGMLVSFFLFPIGFGIAMVVILLSLIFIPHAYAWYLYSKDCN